MAEPEPKAKKGQSNDDIQALRTFESDAAAALSGNKGSAAEIVVAESERRAQDNDASKLAEPQRGPGGKLLLIVIGIFFVSGLIIFAAYLFLKPKELPPPPVTNTGQPIIAIDTEQTIDITNLTKKKIFEAIDRERETATLRLGSVRLIKLSENTAGGSALPLDSSDFFLKLSPSIPAALLRSLDPQYAFGLIGFDGNQPFLILRTDSFETAFGEMLRFEADFYREAGNLFIKGELPGLATTTVGYFGTDLRTRLFHDVVLKNLDTRAVKDKNGNIVFLYAFPDQSTLLFTTNSKTFSELIEKLKRARLIR